MIKSLYASSKFTPTSTTESLFNIGLFRSMGYTTAAGTALGAGYSQYRQVKGDGGVDLAGAISAGAIGGAAIGAVIGAPSAIRHTKGAFNQFISPDQSVHGAGSIAQPKRYSSMADAILDTWDDAPT